jgi:hypothetical protein
MSVQIRSVEFIKHPLPDKPEEAEPEEVPVRKWTCIHCNRPIQTLPYFRKHERDCPTLPGEVSCDLCSFKFGSISQLTGHKRQAHKLVLIVNINHITKNLFFFNFFYSVIAKIVTRVNTKIATNVDGRSIKEIGGHIYKNATGTLSSALYVRPNSLG